MIYLDKMYFSNINRIINSKEYNNCIVSTCPPIFYIDHYNDSHYENVKHSIDLNGFAIVEAVVQDLHTIKDLSKWLEGMLGDIYREANPDRLDYAIVKPEKNAKYYVNSSLAQPIHTDEGYTTVYPRYVALYCYNSSDFGGDSIIVNVKKLIENITEEFPKSYYHLFKYDAITVDGAKGLKTKPLLVELECNRIGISYTSVIKSLKCPKEVFEIYDYITNYVHDVKNQIRFKLQRKQVLIIDNCLALHGRTQFLSNDNRMLYRFWFDRRELSV